ncbi:hypothetical protein [Streptomyces sp. NBC_01506]|uniref:hypothetical protein n=1 Tax=Streptomyces sp. NBC_01506 TaxID=2903887 RepID=UPI003869CC68
MTIQITAPAAQDVATIQRRNYRTALALASHIMSESAVVPTDFTIAVHDFAPDEPTIRFYFHRDPAAVAEFADERWMGVTTEVRDDGSVLTEARGGLCRGVLVTAWTLMPADGSDVVSEVTA